MSEGVSEGVFGWLAGGAPLSFDGLNVNGAFFEGLGGVAAIASSEMGVGGPAAGIIERVSGGVAATGGSALGGVLPAPGAG